MLGIKFLLAAAVAGAAGPPQHAGDSIVHTDEIGRRVELPRHPQRIISLAPAVTETLFLVGAGGRLIGNTISCDWPEEAKRIPKIGDLLTPNYEVILAAKPDLVIASTAGNDRTSVLKLAEFGLPVYVSAPRSVDQIFESVKNLGRIADCAERSEQVVAQMKKRLGDIKRRLEGIPPTRAFLITWFDPLLAPGKNTFENDVLRQANVVSITAHIDEFYPRYSMEQLLVEDPDVILTVKHPANPLPDLKRIAGWRHLSAVRNGRIYLLQDALQHPSPRFVDAVEELARKLHPELFR